jgi:hypothetical protein
MCVCVCVCLPSLLLPLSNVFVSSDTTAGRGGAGASITGGDGVVAAPSIISASASSKIQSLRPGCCCREPSQQHISVLFMLLLEADVGFY